jgi:hypothetical protein
LILSGVLRIVGFESEQIMQSILADRTRYRTSGRVAPEFFIVAPLLAVVAALLMGAAMCGMRIVGFYLPLILPLFAAFAVGGAVGLGVRLGRCRNLWITAILGVSAAALAYASYYHFDMMHARGSDRALRFDALPAHVWWCLETDRIVGAHGPHDPNAPPTTWMNRICFCFDVFFLCFGSAAHAVGFAGRVYSEQTDRWATRHKLKFLPGKGHEIAHALATGRLNACLAGLQLVYPRERQAHCLLVLEAPGEFQPTEGCIAYVTIQEVFSGLWPLVKQVALTPDELLLFQDAFLSRHVEVADIPDVPTEVEPEKPKSSLLRRIVIWSLVVMAVLFAIAVAGELNFRMMMRR